MTGHKKQIKYLNGLLKNNKIPNTFIFSGPKHIGKEKVACSFFWKMSPEAENKERHPDVLEVSLKEEKRNISIEQTRRLKKFISLSSVELNRKLVLIKDAHLMSKEASNSILKILEEPKTDTIIILLTSRSASLPKTITSRSVVLKFQPLNKKEMKKLAQERGFKVVEEDLSWLAGRSELMILYNKNPENKLVEESKKNFNLFFKILDASLTQKFNLIQEILKEESLEEILESWLLASRLKMLENSDRADFYKNLIKKIKETREILSFTNVNKRLWLENLFL